MRVLQRLLPILLVVAAARASPYWIAYEGNDFPENEGWRRVIGHGGAERSIEDGWLVMDTRASLDIYDYYERTLNGALGPGPGETFVLQWRLLVSELLGWRDPCIGVRSDDNWAVGFEYSFDTLWSTFESGVSHKFDPGVAHSYELRSHDMRTYDLYIDNQLALQGSFWLSLAGSRVSWGDGIQGGASMSKWDYVRFGVSPEPSSAVLVIVGYVWLFLRGSRSARRQRT